MLTPYQIRKELEMIYALIPDRVDCKDNCAECCGLIYWTKAEEINIREYLKEHDMEYVNMGKEQGYRHFIEDMKPCPYLDKDTDRCKIYPVRPSVCRLYGLVEEMECPYNPDVKRLSIAKEKEIDFRLKDLNRRVDKDGI